MQATYDIRIEPNRSLIRMTMTGFFDTATVERLKLDRMIALRHLACAPNAHVTLCDISRAEPSSQAIANQFRAFIANPSNASRRLAFVVDSTLARLQMRRIVDRPGVAFFATIEAAEAWLFAP